MSFGSPIPSDRLAASTIIKLTRCRAQNSQAYFLTGLYVLAFVLVFTAFYGFHWLAYQRPVC